MGTKADKRARRLAAALDREWWKAWADAWFWIGERYRYRSDPAYKAECDEIKALRAQGRARARAFVGSLLAMRGLR
jgi:hypothetical protein